MSDGPDHQLYAQAKSILQRVFEIPPAERGAYLESACGNHPELRAEVFSLLAAHEQASGGFLDSPFTLQDGEVETGADPEDRDLTGQRVGAYRLERLLGRGGMGAVYLASRDDGEFKKHVAIKFIRSSAATPSLLRRFRAERQILADIDHPNIARLIDGGTADGMPFFIMEYVPGETLTQVLGQGPLPLARVLLLATAVADVLEAVHAKNMVFRDLKPSNIMLTEQSGVKVLDFGIAKITRDESGEHTTALTESGWIVGSPRYMSPEQASGETVDARSDVFSFGVVVFEALIGRLPFSGESRQEYFKNLITTAAEPLPVVMPEGLRAIVERCLRKSPADRFASGKELAFAMREVVARLDGRRSNSRTVWAALALLAVTIAVGLWAAFKPGASAALLTDRPELIVTWASNETNPRISPDLHWLSFQTDRDGATKIVLRELASGLERTITPLGGEAFGHEWSPASDQIAYLAPSGHETSVTLAPLDDSKPHVFLLRHGQATLVRWIGSGIYYLADGSLWRLDLTSGQSHEITTRRGTLRIREVDVSADEGHLVFTAMKASVSTVFSSGMDGSNPLQLTHDRMDPKSIRFRGVRATEVVYVSEEGGMVDIWKLDLASGKRDRLTMTDTREGDIEVSRDGNTLVYEQVRERANLALLEPGAKTPALRMLTSDSLSDLLPSASSSGNVIAFQRAKTLDMSLGLQSATIHVSRDGLATSSAKLTDGYTPEVSADGRWVASAILKPAAQAELWMTDVDTGKRIPVSNDLLRINYSPFPLQRIGATMAWSPSETSLFFLSKDTVRGTEVKRATPSADGQTVDVQQVTNINDVAATVSDVRVLADGSGLSYLLRLDAPVVTELRLRIFARKEETVSFREASSLRLDCPGWTTNGDALVIRWATDTGRADVVLVKSGKAVEIARGLQDTTRGSFTLDPARRVVYFTRQRGTVHSLYSMKLDSGIESLVFQGEPVRPLLVGNQGPCRWPTPVFFASSESRHRDEQVRAITQRRSGGGMARNANVYGEIADYLETIQTTFIWPALVSKDGKKPGPRTDSLVTFSRLMMSTHAKGSLMLDRGCVTNNDCDQDEECVKGVCMPAGTTTSSFAGSGCRTNNDCDQDEECVDGICTPILGGGFEPAAVANVPFYDGRVKEAFESYFGRIHLVLTKVLAEDPRKLPGVREVLMELYAGAAGTVGSKLPECTRAGDCPDGSACVGGHCVPVPFRLVLKLSPFRAPWK